MSEGQIVKNVTADAPSAVTFNDNPTASVGIVQSPLVPCATSVLVSEGTSDGMPVWRVSINRHGVIGTNVESTSPGAASTRQALTNINVTAVANIAPVTNQTKDRTRNVTVSITHPQGVDAPDPGAEPISPPVFLVPRFRRTSVPDTGHRHSVPSTRSGNTDPQWVQVAET